MKLSKLVLAMCLATGVMSTAVAQVVMRNAISVAQNSHAGEAIDTLAREVEKRTNGSHCDQELLLWIIGWRA
jgi:TRAP-type transport system periplasmic protein